MRNGLQRNGAAMLASICLLTANGCLVTSEKEIDASGTRVSSASLSQVRAGQTTEAWLLATLGPPTSRTIVSEQPTVEVLRYEYAERISRNGTIFLIFAGESEKRTTHTTYFELNDGVVTRHWTEKTRD